MGNETEKDLNKERLISSMITIAKKLPQDLTDHYSLDELVEGIEYVDFKLTERKGIFDSLVAREKGQDPKSAEYAHIQELKKLTVRELETYFDIAENMETALRKFDYVYGYSTCMPDVSEIIWSYKKKEL